MNLFRLAFVLNAALLGSAQAADGPRQPNLLIIQTDEHHYNTLGCYGGRIVDTPHIDWLAGQGALCTSFYATTPVCSPSRAALVSGLYPQHTPVVTNNIPLHDEIVTFAEVLRRQGYVTGYAGKWHLDGNGKPQWAPDRKFGFDDNRYMFNRGHWKKFEDGPDGPRVAARDARGDPSYGLDDADQQSFSTDWLSDKAIEFIGQNSGKPFCYMLSLPDPHGPNTVRAPYDTMYQDVLVPLPSTLQPTAEQIPGWAPPAPEVTANQLRRIMPAYYGMVKCIDDNVGRILDCLRKTGQLEHTVIVLTSDHGDLCGEHARVNKGVPYEGSARIPFIIYFPEKIPAGTVVRPALTCVDFMPTVMALMEVPEDAQVACHGRNAAGLFTAATDVSAWQDVAFMRGTNNWLCAVSDRYKLVASTVDEPWLFDLEQDPDETVNRFDDPQCRQIVKELATQLETYAATYADPYGRVPAIKNALEAARR